MVFNPIHHINRINHGLDRSTWWGLKAETKEGEFAEFIINLPK
jgi:hypothetical protein